MVAKLGVLQSQPDIDAAMLSAGAAAIAGGGEKSVMAARRRVRMIVAVLHHRIRPRNIMPHVGTRSRVVIAMISRQLVMLIVAIIRMVLRASSRWQCDGQCEREQTRNDQL